MARTMRIEEKNMTETEQFPTENNTGQEEKRRSVRTPRAIRFSDPEWERVETAAGKREITPAEFVRNAALAATESELGTFPPEISAQIERIYRGVYLLATLRREEIIREGRLEELDRITKSARESQVSIIGNDSR